MRHRNRGSPLLLSAFQADRVQKVRLPFRKYSGLIERLLGQNQFNDRPTDHVCCEPRGAYRVSTGSVN